MFEGFRGSLEGFRGCLEGLGEVWGFSGDVLNLAATIAERRDPLGRPYA